MSLLRYYGYRDKLILPTVVQAEEGFYMDVEPITVFDTEDATATKLLLANALAATLEHGNKTVPTPERWDAQEAQSPVLRKLDIKKWLKFEGEATMYSLHIYPDKIDYYSTGTPLNGTWNNQQARHISMKKEESSSLIDVMLADLKTDQLCRSEKPKGGLVLLPPPANQ